MSNRFIHLSDSPFVEAAFGDQQLVFDPALAGRVLSWKYSGIELLGSSGSDPVEFGCYPMLPWAGRLAKNSILHEGASVRQKVNYQGWAIHGLALNQPLDSWTIDQSVECTTFTGFQTISNWIEALDVVFVWQIYQRSITTSIQVTPRSAGTARVILGWHPWFKKSLGKEGRAELVVEEAELLVKHDSIPTGELISFDVNRGPFDDTLQVPSRSITIEWPKVLRLQVTNSHKWFVLYTGDENHLCIEPQTGAPNSIDGQFGDSAIACSRSQPAVMTTRWEFTPIGD